MKIFRPGRTLGVADGEIMGGVVGGFDWLGLDGASGRSGRAVEASRLNTPFAWLLNVCFPLMTTGFSLASGGWN